MLTPGQQHEATVFEQLMEQGAIKRTGRGRPRLLPGRIVEDNGYSFNTIRLYLRRKGINYTIPKKSNQTKTGPFEKAIYRGRNRVERLINRLKHNRRMLHATRNGLRTTEPS